MREIDYFTHLSYTHAEKDNLRKCVNPYNPNEMTIRSWKILGWEVGNLNMHSWENLAEDRSEGNLPSWEFRLMVGVTLKTPHEYTKLLDYD